MSLRIAGSRIAQQALRHEIPEFLCPILRNSIVLRQRREFPLHRNPARRLVHAHALPLPPRTKPTERSIYAVERSIYNRNEQRTLPQQCPGCGALVQTVEKEDPGFYTITRKSVREYLRGGGQSKSKARDAEEEIIRASLQNIDGQTAESLALDIPTTAPLVLKIPDIPICDRCHNLKHHEIGVSIHHPSVQSLQDTIFESPYKYNHIYHVIDAADFPMSLVPGIHRLLHLTPQRSLNRRAKGGKFYHGRKTEVSFVITRSDLLAPLKTQVDSMMPYLTTVLRDALGKAGKDIRLGNVRCVSAIRGWWTQELKEDIWGRGGGGWMLGKVNVGKSQLFQDVFPKGRRGHKQAVLGKRNSVVPSIPETSNPYTASTYLEKLDQEEPHAVENEEGHKEVEALDPDSLLPPAQPETDYPTMPLVSSLPGTTASPIRVPFGNGKGELIDLPGLSRGDLELYVQPEHRSSLVMRSRIRPEQQVIKPGQSLLLGGFIRITPLNPELIFLAYAFTPIESHLTATEKAIGTQTQTRESGLLNIALEGTGEKIGSAGMFRLKWDVTKQRTGPVTAKDAAAIKPERLPYRVLSTDILIEGCGWVELVAQVRKRPGEMSQPQNTQLWDEESDLMDEDVVDPYMPVVEVFTPEGKFVAQRRPMNAWMYTAKKPGTTRAKGRPRQSMKGDKKASKVAKRMTVSS